MPQVRAQTLVQPLPGIDKGSIEDRLQVVLQAAADGRVSADEAKVLIDGIRGATEAAAIAAAERELAQIREMRMQMLTNGAVPRLSATESIELVQEESEHVRAA